MLAALAYADVFGSALSYDQMQLWKIGESYGKRRKLSGKVLSKTINGVKYFALPGRQSVFSHVVLRTHYSRWKWQKALSIARILRFVPTVLFVGVTGGVAVENAAAGDDIDFFIVARSGTLWVTRFLAILLLEAFSVRRRPSDVFVMDKVCLNMLMSEDDLSVPDNERDLFTAHEVLQMRPIWERNRTYRRFLYANRWVARYLPAAWDAFTRDIHVVSGSDSLLQTLLIPGSVVVARFFEPIAQWVQKAYMQRRITTEVVTDTMLRFHPYDMRAFIRREYKKRLHSLGISLDKIFYAS